MNEKRCPACGALVQGTEEKCPICGLEGLNRRFLSKAGYEKWVQEVLEPHIAAGTIKVFEGYCHDLILTGRGNLYGIGKNYSGQIEERDTNCIYTLPCLMAKDVISAAPGRHYTIYVTRDGEVHLQGIGEFAERFPGFSGAKTVYADDQSDIFWIEDETDQVWCFGENKGGTLQPRKITHCHAFPEDYYRWVVSQYSSSVWWESDGRGGPDVVTRYRNRPEYREYHRKYGGNLVMRLNEKQLENEEYHWNSAPRYSCKPELYITNEYIYNPIPCPEEQRKEKKSVPCRTETTPRPKELENMPVTKCVSCWILERQMEIWGSSGATDITLWLLEDGSVMLEHGKECKPLQWLRHPVVYLAEYANYVTMICKNGDVLMFKNFPDLKDGTMKVRRLPEDA